MKRFEYKIVAPVINNNDWEFTSLMDELNDSFFNGLGRDGWELVSTIPKSTMEGVKEINFPIRGDIIFIFKRQLLDE